MRPSGFNRTFVLSCALSLCVTAHHVNATEVPPVAKDDYLSVRESLLPMFSFGFRTSNEFFPIHRVNPGVRSYIRFYLEQDSSVYDYVVGGIWLLGIVGTEDDVGTIDRYLQSRLGDENKDEGFRLQSHIVAGASGAFAGMMMRRNVNGAEQFCRKYAQITVWMPSTQDDPTATDQARKCYSYFIMGAYRFSKAEFLLPLLREKSSGPRPFLHESFVEGLESLEMDEYTKMMRPPARSEETLRQYQAGFLRGEAGQWVDMLLARQAYAQWHEAREQQRVAGGKKKPAESFENIDMSATVEGRYVKDIAREATEAFQQVSKTVLDRNAEDAPIKKGVLRDIQGAGLNDYDDLQVTVDVEARVGDFVPATDRGERGAVSPTVTREKQAAAVTFRIQGTADIFNRHVPEASPNAPVSPTTGDVIIQMTRADDIWQWGSGSDAQASAVAGIVEDEYLIENVGAATVAYAQIARMLINGEYDPLTIPVVDNGRLIPLEKRKRDADEMAQALDMEKRILVELMNARLNTYGDHRIRVRLEATLGPGGIAAGGDPMSLPARGSETADVTFAIRNAAGAYRKHAPERSRTASLDEAGNLQVHMKRINGKWYWNPFGW